MNITNSTQYTITNCTNWITKLANTTWRSTEEIRETMSWPSRGVQGEEGGHRAKDQKVQCESPRGAAVSANLNMHPAGYSYSNFREFCGTWEWKHWERWISKIWFLFKRKFFHRRAKAKLNWIYFLEWKKFILTILKKKKKINKQKFF